MKKIGDPMSALWKIQLLDGLSKIIGPLEMDFYLNTCREFPLQGKFHSSIVLRSIYIHCLSSEVRRKLCFLLDVISSKDSSIAKCQKFDQGRFQPSHLNKL